MSRKQSVNFMLKPLWKYRLAVLPIEKKVFSYGDGDKKLLLEDISTTLMLFKTKFFQRSQSS